MVVNDSVELAHKLNGGDVFLAAVLVGNPLALLPGIIQVDHAGHGVDTQPVHMKFLEPVQGVGQQEVFHLMAVVIKDVGAPIGVFALARVFVLKKAGAVETAQPPGILGEVGRHPVENDADAVLVADVDQIAQIFRRA